MFRFGEPQYLYLLIVLPLLAVFLFLFELSPSQEVARIW